MKARINKKRSELIQWLIGCGFDAEGAERELNSMLRCHTNGIDAVTYEYAIDLIWSDIYEERL